MARYRFWLNYSLSVVMALVFVQIGRSQHLITAEERTAREAAATPTCKVYSLAELGDDPKLCKWIAETIPEMIQPATWKQGDAKLSYYAPSKILVINNTPAVHAQVDEFLQSMRKTLPQKVAATKIDAQVMPAQFQLQDSSRPVGAVQTGPASYPVPISPVGPKHLFHFIIRYEGEGIIDANVAKFAKALSEGAAANGSNYFYPQPAVQPAAPTVCAGACCGMPGANVAVAVPRMPAAEPVAPPASLPLTPYGPPTVPQAPSNGGK